MTARVDCEYPHPSRQFVSIRGRQSTVSILGDDAGPRACLKTFKDSYETLVVPEYSALERFHVALSESTLSDILSTPTPIHLCSGQHAYLMTFVDGVPLADFVRGAARADVAEVCWHLAEGLMLFHTTIGHPYGDFHTENVLVGARLWLLDPIIDEANEWPVRAGFDPLDADLGYWWFSTAVRGVRRCRPGWILPRLRTVAPLIQAAAALSGQRSSTLCGRAQEVAHGYVERLRFDGGARSIVVSTGGTVILTVSARLLFRRGRHETGAHTRLQQRAGQDRPAASAPGR